MTKSAESRLSCSFCKKTAAEVAHLIAGPHVNICNSCVDICRGMIEANYPEYRELEDVQIINVPDGPIKVSEVVALVSRYHFDTRVKLVVGRK